MEELRNTTDRDRELKRHFALFRDMLPLRLELDAVSRFFHGVSLSGSRALDVGLRSPVMSHVLRGLGGTWQSAVYDPELEKAYSSALGEPVALLSAGDVLPFPDKRFDWVVAGLGVLSGQPDEAAFIEECHRVLRPAGHLLISVEHAKPLGMAPLAARLAGWRPFSGAHRGAYSERELFEILKSGFDVLLMRSYSRFWTQLVRFWETARLDRMARRGEAGRQVLSRSRFFPNLYRIAYQLDAPLFMTRGYVLLVHARRHTWRARTAPVLSDGRNITEAVLTRAQK